MRRWTYGVLTALMFIIWGAALAADLTFPQLTGRVVDGAGLLDNAQEAELTAKLAALEAKTTDQLVVVTLKSLQNTSIEDFGYQLGRHWGIGQKNKNNGVLLIVAPNERKVRIEVGYGLEGVLTDALSRIIIETSITPRFRKSDMPGGIIAGADDIITALSGDADAIAQRVASRPEASNEWLAVLFPFLIFIVIFIIIWRGGGTMGGTGGSRRSSGSSWSSSGGGFSGGGGSFGGGGSSGSW